MANIKSRSASAAASNNNRRNTADAWANVNVVMADGSTRKVTAGALSMDNYIQAAIIEAQKNGESLKFEVEINVVDKDTKLEFAKAS
ncbi:hypothetical protein [Marisediminitalea sp.]|uniref:hypothetical protein n=1 Tax=Marisediminitalea sp. TaxID=2662268 RepID=UPI0035189801